MQRQLALLVLVLADGGCAKSAAPVDRSGASDAVVSETGGAPSIHDAASVGEAHVAAPQTLTPAAKSERAALLRRLDGEVKAMKIGRVDQQVGDRPSVWVWQPTVDVHLVIAAGCNATAHLTMEDRDLCGVLVEGSHVYIPGWSVTVEIPDGGVSPRVRGVDDEGPFTRELSYVDGGVQVGERLPSARR